MQKFLKKLTGFSLLSLLPDLDDYTIETRPRRNVVVEKPSAAKGQVFEGQEWQTEWDAKGNFEARQVKPDVPASPSLVILDEYDAACLDYVFGKDWRRDESRAKVMKWHWLRQESALQIQKYHTANGKLERGYSERSAAPYVKAFYQADDERDRDGKPRCRMEPANAGQNVFDWE